MWMTSGPLCDCTAAVIRDCRSLALMNSSWTSAPSALLASPIWRLSSTSQAGMKSTQRRTCSLVPWANAGAVRVARRAPSPAPVVCRKIRRVVMVSGLVDLLELALGPLHRVLGLGALHGLGVHVHDDVLRVGLGGLGRGRPGVAEHERGPRG